MSQLIGHSRRAFVGLALATAAAVSARDASSIGRAKEAMPSVPAHRFADAIGICAHPSWRSTVWGSSDWPTALINTGVRNVRARVGNQAAGRAGMADLRPFLRRGGRLCALVTGNDQQFDLKRISDDIDFLAREVGARGLSAIEGPNEYNKPSRRPHDWAQRLRQFQGWLHDRVRGDPRLNGVPVVAPSIWGRLRSDYRSLGNLGSSADKSCLHYYTGGRRPSRAGVSASNNELGGLLDYSLAQAMADARTVAPGKPLWITEFGYPVAGPGQPLSPYTITESAAAKYLLRGLFDAFGEGAERIFIYSLIDDVRDPPRYHGLMDGALRPRPAYSALKNLMALMGGSSTVASAASLAYAVSNVGNLRQQLFHSGENTFLLVLYRDVDSFDRTLLRDVSVAPTPVTVTLGAAAKSIETFAPTVSVAARQRVANAWKLTVPVGDDVTIVRISA